MRKTGRKTVFAALAAAVFLMHGGLPLCVQGDAGEQDLSLIHI